MLHPRLPLPPPLMMLEVGSFAHQTLTQRMPAIARQVITDHDFAPDIVENLETLIRELPGGAVRSLNDDSGSDLKAWNKYLDPWIGKSWQQLPWFLAETYFYRRVLEATHYFQAGPFYAVDPFQQQKRLGLDLEMDAMQNISSLIHPWIQADPHQTRNADIPLRDRVRDQTNLRFLLYSALWGNRADLSLWQLVTETTSHTSYAVHPEQSHILVDDTPTILNAFSGDPLPRVDIILDNAGFELFCDLCIVDFLLSIQRVNTIYLHVKTHPIFVSDATKYDVLQTLATLAATSKSSLHLQVTRLQRYLAQGHLIICDDLLWTSPLAFWQMPTTLYRELAQSNLIVVKGDANYRRLLGDRQWAFTTPFSDIVSYSPAPLVALRTLKSEIACGLTPDQLVALNARDPQWLIKGGWGVIQATGLNL